MKIRILTIAVLSMLTAFAASAADYDAALAASYARLFAPVSGAGAGKALHCITPEKFLQDIQACKPLVSLDVRTPNESGVVGITLPQSLAIPVSQVFEPENLARLPRDPALVVICQSGIRASAVATALRHIGFDNAYILKGGLKALAAYLDPKNANPPLAPPKP